MRLKPTNKKPLGIASKKMEKNFNNGMKQSGIDLTEVDSMLTEKQQSFKKKFWDLAKMESLVHSDPILSAEFQDMSEDGQEKYGYHYNETIMNMLFNKYVTHDQGYQNKYLNAIPAEKERRDKSGVQQLQQKGEEKMNKKQTSKAEPKPKEETPKEPKAEGDVPIHNNSLEGVIEEDGILGNTLNRDGGGTFEDSALQNHLINKKFDTTSNTMENGKINNEGSFAHVARQHDDYSDLPIGKANKEVMNDRKPLNVNDYVKNSDDMETMDIHGLDKEIGMGAKENPFEGEIKETTGEVLNSTYKEQVMGDDGKPILTILRTDNETYVEYVLYMGSGYHNNLNYYNADFDVYDAKHLFAHVKGELEKMGITSQDQVTMDDVKKILNPINNVNITNETTTAESSGQNSAALDYKNGYPDLLESSEDCGCDDCEDCGEEILDETNTSASSGAYEGPFRKKSKNHVTNKPAWKGGIIIGESYLTNAKFFKKLHENINNTMNENNTVTPEMVDKTPTEAIQRSLSDLLNIPNMDSNNPLVVMFQDSLRKRGVLKGGVTEDMPLGKTSGIDLSKLETKYIEKLLGDLEDNKNVDKNNDLVKSFQAELISRGVLDAPSEENKNRNLLQRFGRLLGLTPNKGLGETFAGSYDNESSDDFTGDKNYEDYKFDEDRDKPVWFGMTSKDENDWIIVHQDRVSKFLEWGHKLFQDDDFNGHALKNKGTFDEIDNLYRERSDYEGVSGNSNNDEYDDMTDRALGESKLRKPEIKEPMLRESMGRLEKILDFAYKYDIQPTGNNGKFKLEDMLPIITDPIDKDDIYAFGEHLANRQLRGIGIGWSDLPDINSIWDVADGGYRDVKSFALAIKELVQERLSDVDSEFGGMFGEGNVNEEPKSQAQRRFFYAVKDAKEKGGGTGDVKKAADSMTNDQIDDFTVDSHKKGLPDKIDEINPVVANLAIGAGGAVANKLMGEDETEAIEKYSRIFNYSDAIKLAHALDNSPAEEENAMVKGFAQKRNISLVELKYQIQNFIDQRLKGSDSPEFFKMEGIITVINDMMDQASDIRKADDKAYALKQYSRTPAGREEKAAEKAAMQMDEPIGEGTINVETREDKIGYIKDAIYTMYGGASHPDFDKLSDEHIDKLYDDYQEKIKYGGKVTHNTYNNKNMTEAESVNNGDPINNIALMLQKIFPKQYDTIEGFKDLAHLTVKTFFGGDYNRAYEEIKKKMGTLVGEGIISADRETMSMGGDNAETMARTMKGLGGSSMMEEGDDVRDLKNHGRSDDVKIDASNSLDEFGVSKHGLGGFNKAVDEQPNYKEPDKYGAPRNKDLSKYNSMTESKEQVCENCGSPLDEDGHCRRDEKPVAGKIAGEEGSCKKKKQSPTKDEKNKFNVKFRKKKEQERVNTIEKTHDDYKKELDKSKKHMKKLKEMVEGTESISEEKRPAALVQMDRLHKDNKKNFKKDLKDSNTGEVAKAVAKGELTAGEQIEEVPENAYELAEKIEKQKIKDHEFNALKNEGNSTNDEGDEIPKRNASDEEADAITLDRGLGMQDIVYDNETGERFEKRLKKDLGDKIYKQRQDKMEYREGMPMYNKDTEPVGKGIKKNQFDKDKSKFNSPKGIKMKENHIVAAKYRDNLNKLKFVNFNINEAVEAEKGDGARLSLEGMGNTYTQGVNENVEMRNMLDSWDFYMKAGKVTKVGKGKQTLTEGEEKPVMNEEVQKMMKLAGYKPSDYVDTSGMKKNAKFRFTGD